MQVYWPYKQAARVEMHLPGGFTRVQLYAVNNGAHRLDIPTDVIPVHLRRLGSKFLVAWPCFTPGPNDTVDQIREMWRQVRVEELNPRTEGQRV